MRVLYLTRTYTRHDARWLRVLAEQGLSLGFLSLQEVNGDEIAGEHSGIELLTSPRLPAGADTLRLDAAEAIVRDGCAKWQPDVILAGPLTDAGYLAIRIMPERTLLMSWAFDVLHESAVSTEAGERLRFTLRGGQHLMADCGAIVRECESIAGRKYRNVCVLPWGLAAEDKPAPAVGLRRRLGDQAAKVVLYTRGCDPIHQPQTVIEAFRFAHAQDDTLRLWLAGAGALRERLETMVDAAGLRSAVRFLGQLNQCQLAGAFAEADVYLACSLSDGSSISLLQAMHAGLPCIVSDLSGNREWLEPGGGWLVPAGSPAAFARALTDRFQLSPDSRAQLAARNRACVNRRANLANNLPRLLSLLDLLAGKSRSAATSQLSFAV
jgi:L-malate glycosyltransferase